MSPWSWSFAGMGDRSRTVSYGLIRSHTVSYGLARPRKVVYSIALIVPDSLDLYRWYLPLSNGSLSG